MQHNEGNFKGYQGFNIYYQCWLPANSDKLVAKYKDVVPTFEKLLLPAE